MVVCVCGGEACLDEGAFGFGEEGGCGGVVVDEEVGGEGDYDC